MSDGSTTDAEMQKLISELALEHGVALDRSDPILVLQTATRRIVSNVLCEARQSIGETLAEHRSELELAARKWEGDAQRSASQLVQDVRSSIRSSVARELSLASGVATAQLKQSLVPHEKMVARATLVCAASAAVSVLAAGAVVWTSYRTSGRSDVLEQRAAHLESRP